MKEPTDCQYEAFCRLGERIGDGDLEGSERVWAHKEYKRLLRICCPEVKEIEKQRRQERNKIINKNMASLISDNFCHSCHGELKQTRSGSKTVICMECGSKFKAVSKK